MTADVTGTRQRSCARLLVSIVLRLSQTPPESRKNWIASLDRLAALNPAIVVAGHKKPGAPDSPSTIQDTKRYLQDFDRLQKTATSDQELFDQMTELYPHWVANQSWLMFGFPQP